MMTLGQALHWLAKHGYERNRENVLRVQYAAQNGLQEEQAHAVVRGEWERMEVDLVLGVGEKRIQMRQVFYSEPKEKKEPIIKVVAVEQIDDSTLEALEREAELADADPT